MVLPLLHGSPLRGRFTSDQTLARRETAYRAVEKELRSSRFHVPPKTKAGITALGL